MGHHFLLQGIFLTQGLNSHPLHCRQTLYLLSHQGSRCLHLSTMRTQSWFFLMYFSLDRKTDLISLKEQKRSKREIAGEEYEKGWHHLSATHQSNKWWAHPTSHSPCTSVLSLSGQGDARLCWQRFTSVIKEDTYKAWHIRVCFLTMLKHEQKSYVFNQHKQMSRSAKNMPLSKSVCLCICANICPEHVYFEW